MGCCTGYTFTSAPDAALDPNQRVNFTFGMVLGVDDFRQEHAYLGGRDERALRELIGYGAITGLDVGTTVTGSQVAVRVAPGLALLPDGKLVGVKTEQCARLDEWLAGPGKLASSPSGPASVYVVLRHVEVTGTPVPIPGEPCRDESALLADSRIADSYTLDFSWTAPAQAEDDALRTFAAWLRRVDILPAEGTPLATFLAAVEAQVTAAIAHAAPAFAAPPLAATPLPDPDPASADAEAEAQLIIPRDQYTTYINAAFDVWVRRLRGAALAPFGPVPAADPAAEAGLLLAAVDVVLEAGNLVFPPAPAVPAVVRWLGRAQLVHLQMLQQWLISSSATDAPVDADYVLGRADPHLPNAQDLLADFALTDHALARIDLVAAPLPGNPDARKAVLRPAVKWPGGAGADGGPDYYGPAMTAPIPVADGGTGQNDAPAPGQLLVGVAGTEDLAAHFSLGDLLPVERQQDGDAAPLANLTVDVTSAAPDILIDTIQDIGPQDSPQFAGLSVDGALSAGALTLDTPLSTGSGGTGQNAVPADGQLLVGVAGTGEDPAHFALGDLRAVTRSLDSEADIRANLTVDVASAAPDILIDTIQDIGPFDSPQFGGLKVLKAADIGSLTLGAPLPIASGGSGQSVLPQRLQVLVGERDDADGRFVLARLTDSETVAVTLEQLDEFGDWQIQFNASGSGLALPVAVDQGGTGQDTPPESGQLLIGVASTGEMPAQFVLGALRPVERFIDSTTGPASNLTVDVVSAAPDILIDTIQAIGPLDSPQFAGLAVDGEAMVVALTLATPLPIASGGSGQSALPQRLQVLVGERDGDDGQFVLASLVDSATVAVTLQQVDDKNDWRIQFDAQGGTSQTHWATRIVDEEKGELNKDDHVLLFVADNEKVMFALGDPEDERVVVIKAATKGTAVRLVRGTGTGHESDPLVEGEAEFIVNPMEAVTLIGSRKLERWFVIGRN